jgi:hypothetical protein
VHKVLNASPRVLHHPAWCDPLRCIDTDGVRIHYAAVGEMTVTPEFPGDQGRHLSVAVERIDATHADDEPQPTKVEYVLVNTGSGEPLLLSRGEAFAFAAKLVTGALAVRAVVAA